MAISVNNASYDASKDKYRKLDSGENTIQITVTNGNYSSVYNVTAETTAKELIATHPTSRTVTAGTSVNLSVTVASGVSVLHYQWQTSGAYSSVWTDLTNGTARSYNIPSVSASMSGRRYRCVVTTRSETDVSNIAKITTS